MVAAVAMLAAPGPLAVGSQDYEIFRAEPSIAAGMHVVFRRIAARTVTEFEWRVTVQESGYPKSVKISWVRPRADGSVPDARLRVLTAVDKGRTLGPVFGIGDPDETEWTAPWVSQLRDAGTGKRAYNFRIGGVGPSDCFGRRVVEERSLSSGDQR